MKILMISPQFRPLVGGYERAAERLSICLARRGHDITLFAERRSTGWPRRESLDGVIVRRWWCLYMRGCHSATSLLGLMSLLLRCGRQFEVWHVHSYGPHAALTIAMGSLLKVPVVVKMVNTGSQGLAESVACSIAPRLTAWLYRRASCVVALTARMAREAENFGIANQSLRVIPNGVELRDRARSGDCAVTNAEDPYPLNGRAVVVSVGRLVPQKDLDCLLHAWERVGQRIRKNWVLCVVGDGPERLPLASLARELGIQDDVIFVGHSIDVNYWMDVAELFVQSSRNEGLSNSMLEALAAGLPVVCTDVSGARECVHEPQTGLVVPVGNPAALADAIAKMVDDQTARAGMSERATALIRDRYSISRVIELYESLYVSIAGNRRARQAP